MGPRKAAVGGRNARGKGCAGWWRTHAGDTTGTFAGTPIWGHETFYWVGATQGARAVLGGGRRMRA
eukprot:5994206-Pyramimonas_sp.AAC.1